MLRNLLSIGNKKLEVSDLKNSLIVSDPWEKSSRFCHSRLRSRFTKVERLFA